MKIQKEAFAGLMEYYKALPLQNKRIEVINFLEKLISEYSKLCTYTGNIPEMNLNKEMLNINRENLSENEFLAAVFAYLNTLQEINAQFINSVCDLLENKE